MESYDEDLQENPFFVKLLQMFPTLYEDAPHHKWMVCVPRRGSVKIEECLEDDFQCHILQPLDLTNPGSSHCTLNGKVLKIDGTVIMPKCDDADTMPVHILFKELIYNSQKEWFTIVCTEGPLQGNKNQTSFLSLNSLPDCVGFLRQEISDLTVLSRIDQLSRKLAHRSTKDSNDEVPKQVNTAHLLYEQALRIVNDNADLKCKAQTDQVFRNNLHLAIETYIAHGLYATSIQDLKNVHAIQDAALNRTIRNCQEILPQQLGIGPELLPVIPRARQELAKLAEHTTPLGKLCCLKKAIGCMERQETTSRSATEPGITYTTEDIIPFLVFLILRSTIANWLAHLAYIKEYRLSAVNDAEFGEHSFHTTTLEAAITHIKTNALKQTKSNKCAELDFICAEESSASDSVTPLFPQEKQAASGRTFLKMVSEGRKAEVLEMLETRENRIRLQTPDLCHPLCQCVKCGKQVKALMAADAKLLATRDERGRTALHLAVHGGFEELTDALIAHKADVSAVDGNGATPLHLACLRGNQNLAFLLLHFGASLTACDSEGNIPLHNTVANGHVYCVKLLLYCDEQMGLAMDVNCPNRMGDTPLHIASTLGFNEIVSLLLQFGASVCLTNKNRQTSLDCAHSSSTAALLREGQHQAKAGLVRRRSTFQMPSVRRKHATNNAGASRDNSDSSAASSPSSPQSPRPYYEKSKVEKLLRAVELNDVKLVSFYLGVNIDELEETEVRLPTTLCHPLCQCDECKPVQEAALRLHRCTQAAGLSVNCRTADGVTPLHVASLHGHVTIVELLLRCGATIDALDSCGRTPVQLAHQAGREQVIKLLTEQEKYKNPENPPTLS